MPRPAPGGLNVHVTDLHPGDVIKLTATEREAPEGDLSWESDGFTVPSVNLKMKQVPKPSRMGRAGVPR